MAVFRGIPYAAPPVGELRWRPPEPHVPRAGNQDASRFGSACPQLQGNPDWHRDVAQKFGWSPDEIPDLTDIREDCLYLNVWSQNLNGDAPQPVMVWIHGGNNIDGFSHEPHYFGHNLAKRDVVVVSINYRLGALGFMAHPALTAESDRKVSGNYGLLDQIAALEWVRDNIASFGGDPDRVTVFGESAGAGDIGTLIASPLARGLFRRAIIQSGGYPLYNTATVSDDAVFGVKLMSALGVGDGPGQLEKMRALSWQEIVAAVPSAAPGSFTGAVVDGWLLPEPAADIFEAQEQNPTEIVIGSNANEWLMYLTQPVDEKQLHAVLKQKDSGRTSRRSTRRTEQGGERGRRGKARPAERRSRFSLPIARDRRRAAPTHRSRLRLSLFPRPPRRREAARLPRRRDPLRVRHRGSLAACRRSRLGAHRHHARVLDPVREDRRSERSGTAKLAGLRSEARCPPGSG